MLTAGDGEFSPAATSTAATATAGVGDASESDMRIEGGSALMVARVRVSQGGGAALTLRVRQRDLKLKLKWEGRKVVGGLVIRGEAAALGLSPSFIFFKFIERFKTGFVHIRNGNVSGWSAG